MGSKDFVSDLIVWSSNFTKKSFELKEAYASLEKDQVAIKTYLSSKGIKENEIVFSSVTINKEYTTSYDENANIRSQIFNGYTLSQNVQIESKEVAKIENVARPVSELIIHELHCTQIIPNIITQN